MKNLFEVVKLNKKCMNTLQKQMKIMKMIACMSITVVKIYGKYEAK